MTATLMEQGSAWARRQEWHNGRFADVDRSTAEVLSEHRHTPFQRDPYHERAEETTARATTARVRQEVHVECIDGKWYEIDNATGEPRRRMYTQAERTLAVRLCLQDRSPARVARFMEIPAGQPRAHPHEIRRFFRWLGNGLDLLVIPSSSEVRR